MGLLEAKPNLETQCLDPAWYHLGHVFVLCFFKDPTQLNQWLIAG